MGGKTEGGGETRPYTRQPRNLWDCSLSTRPFSLLTGNSI